MILFIFIIILSAIVILYNLTIHLDWNYYKNEDEIIFDGISNVPIFTYTPPNLPDNAPIFFVIHGANKTANSYRDYCKSLADEFQAMIVAPLFDYKSYSKGGTGKPGTWSFSNATILFDKIAGKRDYFLIGHSGGSQFIDRYIVKENSNVKGIIMANAGTYVFPKMTWDWPYGYGNATPSIDLIQVCERIFKIPTVIYLGEQDTKHDAEQGVLDSSPEANLQGLFRFSRGENYFEFCQSVALENNMEFNWIKLTAQGIGHNAPKMFNNEQMKNAIKYCKNHKNEN